MHFQFSGQRDQACALYSRGILDIIVDLRPESSTYLQHISVELNEDNHRAIFVPERFAHGYQTLHDNTDRATRRRVYSRRRVRRPLQRSAPRTAVAAPVTVVSEKDQKFTPLDQSESGGSNSA